MANLHRAFAAHTAGKIAYLATDKTATLGVTPVKVVLTLTGEAKNLSHCTLDQPIALTLAGVAHNDHAKASVNRPITPTLTATANVVRIGTLNKSITPILTAVANYGQNATLNKSITLTLTSDVRVETKGQLSSSLKTNHPISLVGVGNAPNKAALAQPIALSLTGAASNTKATLAKSIDLALSAAGTSLYKRGIASLPSFTGDATAKQGTYSSTTFPAFTGDAVLETQGLANASATMPAFQGSASTGHSSSTTLPAFTTTASAQGGNLLTATTSLPALTGNANLIPDDSGYSDTTLPALTGLSTVVSSSIIEATQILPSVVSDAVLLAGLDSDSATVLPAFTGTAELQSNQLLVSVTALPAFLTVAVMDNGVTLTTNTFVFNTENLAATEYSNYDFIAMAMFNGVPVGISTGGVFELTGANDAGTNIDVDVLSGFDDLGTEDLKRMPNVYVGYKSDGNVQFQVSIDGEPAVRTYTVSHVSSTSGIKRGRARPGKGLKSRYWQVGVKNVAGSDIELDDLGLYVQQFNRKAQ